MLDVSPRVVLVAAIVCSALPVYAHVSRPTYTNSASDGLVFMSMPLAVIVVVQIMASMGMMESPQR